MEIMVVGVLALAVVLLVLYFRGGGRERDRCTRCDGTGEIHERWPDPKEPGGWHVVDGRCPRCKGKGWM
jgi:hypothetical protein